MDTTPTDEQMKECLEEVGLYEANMKHDELVNFYNVIKSSESTANEENKQRSLRSSTSSSKSICKAKVSESDKESNNNESDHESQSDEVLSQNKIQKEDVDSPNDDYIDVFDCPRDTHVPLPLLPKQPKYAPPFYCQADLNDLTPQRKAKMIYNYHLKVLEHFHKFQRSSFHSANWGKPILANARFNGNLCRKRTYIDEDDNTEFKDYVTNEPEVYVLRTGRQTKRKQYTEHEVVKSKSRNNPPEDKDLTPTNNNSVSRKRPVEKSNEEIIKRSKLFQDSPKQSRTEKMFDKLKESDKKQKLSQRNLDKFHESLKFETDDGIDEGKKSPILSVADLVHKEEPFTRKRIVPPLENGKNKRKQKIVPDIISISEDNDSSTKQDVSKDSDFEDQDKKSFPRRRKPITSDNVSCPICEGTFLKSDIEAHAANCGLSSENTSEADIPESPIKNSTNNLCFKCNKYLFNHSDYEKHILDCKSDNKMK